MQISFWVIFAVDVIMTDDKTVFGQFSRVNAIFSIRTLRIVDLLAELKDFKIILLTMENLTVPIISKLLFLFVVFYLYAIVGQKVYGGSIHQ